MFELPSYQELSEEQDSVYRLPLKGTHLVVGPPGTGKTVIAVYRAEMYRNDGQVTRFLMFNNTLDQYLSKVVEERRLDNETSTFHSWFKDWHKRNIGGDPPEIEPFIFDWDQIWVNIARKGLNHGEAYSHVVIDEGQDFPIDMYRVVSMFVNNLTVFADENQRIFEHNTTVNEMKQVLGLDEVHMLTKNYRNTEQIAKFAAQFYTGLKSGIPELPERQGPKPRFHRGKDWSEQMNIIIRYANNNPSKHIGVFVLTKKQAKALYKSIKYKLSDSVPLQMYMSDNFRHKEINFNLPGIKLMCYASAKGLEFDTVFLPLLHDLRTDANVDNEKMRFFVLASRARDELILMTERNYLPRLMGHVPSDLYRILD